jgi:hypothetical protein
MLALALLQRVRQVGPVQAEQMLACADITPTRTIGELTSRQRAGLAALLRLRADQLSHTAVDQRQHDEHTLSQQILFPAASLRTPSAATDTVSDDDHARRSPVRTTSIQIDDVVEALVKGRRIVGRVTDVNDGVVYFRPICPGARVAARESARNRHALAQDGAAWPRAKGRDRAVRSDARPAVVPRRPGVSAHRATS